MASESTSLLLWDSRRLSSAEEEWKSESDRPSTRSGPSRKNAVKFVAVAVFLVASIAGAVFLLSARQPHSTLSSSSSTRNDVRQADSRDAVTASEMTSLASISADMTVDLWDEWKARATGAGTWLKEKTAGQGDLLRHRAKEYGSEARGWWNETVEREALPEVEANAEKFGNQVKSWWSDVENESAAAGTALETKEQALETNFQKWWAQASAAERSWWNATVHQLQQDDKVAAKWWNASSAVVTTKARDWGDKASDELAIGESAVAEKTGQFWDATKQAIKHDESVVAEKSGEFWDATKQAIKHDESVVAEKSGEFWDATKQAAKRDEAAIAEKSGEFWDATKQTIKHDESAVAEKTGEFWDATKQTIKQDESAVAEKTGEFWDATKQAVKRDESVVAEKTGEFWDATKQAAKHDEAVVAEKTGEFWDATKQAAKRDESAVADKTGAWWEMVKGATRGAWNGTVTAERDWWNASEHWFEDHLHRHAEDPATLPLLYLNSTDSYSLLMNGYSWYDFSADFFLLSSGLDAQINQAYCAVASSAALLNSLRDVVSLPVDPNYDPHPYATQKILLDNACVQTNVIHHNESYDGIFKAPGGLSLDQTQVLLECNLPQDFNVSARHVDPETVSVDDVRRDLESALMDPGKRVIVNYDRKALGQPGGGHFSPIGSYSKKQDAFLIMDVAKYRFPPVWYVLLAQNWRGLLLQCQSLLRLFSHFLSSMLHRVPAARLHSAVSTIDNCGDWDFPNAQDKLRDHRSLHPHSSGDYEHAMKKLDCKAEYRGYIVVELPSDSL